ncbi:dynein axonemal assembly factor 3 homolog [Oryza sativa Japonica Group]|uniref:Uncharacterized protein n=1 Tax=Oryza sativa subsp. japonica TaxID=39947 RepID=Q6YX63_ORYSJ|nr:hypothetical protein [Oryza sativa Japonica Group]
MGTSKRTPLGTSSTKPATGVRHGDNGSGADTTVTSGLGGETDAMGDRRAARDGEPVDRIGEAPSSGRDGSTTPATAARPPMEDSDILDGRGTTSTSAARASSSSKKKPAGSPEDTEIPPESSSTRRTAQSGEASGETTGADGNAVGEKQAGVTNAASPKDDAAGEGAPGKLVAAGAAMATDSTAGVSTSGTSGKVAEVVTAGETDETTAARGPTCSGDMAAGRGLEGGAEVTDCRDRENLHFPER